jgi:hypothetical protein
MKANYYVIEGYISYLTEGRMASDPDAIGDWPRFESEFDKMFAAARAKDDEGMLKQAIDSLVADPEGRIDEFVGQVHGFSEEDMVDLLTHAFEHIWPDDLMSPLGDGPKMEFVPMSDAEWAARRGRD